MRKGILAGLFASLVGAGALVCAIMTSSGNSFGLPIAAGAGDSPYSDYHFELTANSNVLSPSSSYFAMQHGSLKNVSYEGYTHESDDAWGVLSGGGFFSIDESVTGLTSIEYHISGDLTIEYGFGEYDKPTFYSAPLPSQLNSFSFPDGQGQPDRITIRNSSGNDVVITDMTFNYVCSGTDGHVHKYDNKICASDGGDVRYFDHCEICASEREIDLHAYQIYIGTNSGDKALFDPYNLNSYSGIGALSFNYASDMRFVLTLDGDHAGTNIYIDSNVADSSKSQIYVRSQNNAKIHDLTFKGGYGVLLFEGEKLTFANGGLYTEAYYTTVRSPLSFEDTRKTKNAIQVDSGQLTVESGADIDISGYKNGMYLKKVVDGVRDLHFSGGTIDIKECDTGIFSDYGASLKIRSDLKISGCKTGIHNCTVRIGEDDGRTGLLLIDVDNTQSASDSRAIGIKFDDNTSYKLEFVRGKAAIYSHNWDYTSAVQIANGWNNGILTVSSNFQYGFCNIGWGFDGNNAAVYNNDYSGTSASTFYYASLSDLAWSCGSKPQGTNLADAYPSTWESEFYSRFGIA